MNLPNQTELLNLFSSFLVEAGLSQVSIKNYLSDLRHFLSFCEVYSTANSNSSTPASIEEIFQNINKYVIPYVENQKATFTPKATTNRRLASIRRFSTFLSVKFNLSNVFTYQTTSEQIINTKSVNPENLNTKNISDFLGTNQNISTTSGLSSETVTTTTSTANVLSSAKILDQFRNSLEKEKKTHSTIKNYLSDLNHFFLWTANQTPYTTQNLVNILSETQLNAYITYLKLSHTSTSVINRRQSSVKKLAKFCFNEGYLPENPFEFKAVPQRLAPLAWIERLSHKPKKAPAAPKKGLALIYDRYTSLPWTPYLNIALLVLATTAMAIFAYNQIISAARPSAAATALTPPRRQLSFQGRLTDTSGNPITTAVSVVFRLFDSITGGTQLYTTNTCSISPDQDGIFNTLIGDGVCGAEIPSSVFTDNRDVFMEIQVGAETLSPRQQIATVGFALNSETLQGYPASASATINTVPVVDNAGNINIAAASPSIISTNGTFSVVGQSVAIQTAENSGGDIIIQPDAIGSGRVLVLGGTTSKDSMRVTNANLTTGSLISGYVGNDLPTGYLINLSSGSIEDSKFWVATDGRTNIHANSTESALIVDQSGSGNIISASSSGSTVFTLDQTGNLNITGNYLVNGSPLSTSNWQRTAGSLAPKVITDAINLGSTSTSSAFIHFAGTAGDNSFINNGNFGINQINPSYNLDVSGTARITSTVNLPSLTANRLVALDVSKNLSNSIDSSGLAASITDETGTGLAVFNDSPVFANQITVPLVIGGDTPTSFLQLRATSNASSSSDYIAFQVGDNGSREAMRINHSGNVGINTTSPNYTLDVAGDVNITGALRDNGNAGSSGQILSTTGTGIEWINAPSSSNYWQRNDGALSPIAITDAINTGNIATSSALTHLAGTAGDNSFIDNANFGVGTRSPAYTLDVTGDINVTAALRDNGNPGTSGQILSSTGTGIEWIDSSNINFWQRNSGSLAPLFISDALNIGAVATSSAFVHFAGTTGDNSFIDNGFFGIGTRSPSYTLDVNGNENLTGALYANGNPGTSGQILSSTGTGIQWIDNVATSSSAADSFWQEIAGVLSPVNISDSLAIGGTSTASALFYVDGATNGSASTAGTLSFKGTTDPKINILNSENFGIQTSVGGNAGLIERITILNNGNVGINNTSPTAKLDVIGNIGMSQNSIIGFPNSSDQSYTPYDTNFNSFINSRKGVFINIDANNDDPDTNVFAIGKNKTDNSTSGELFRINENGTVGINNSTPLATLDVHPIVVDMPTASISGSTTVANTVLDQSGTGDIFTASTSGQTRFTIHNNGNISASGTLTGLTGLQSSGTITFSDIGSGVVHSSSGTLSTSNVSLTTEVTGILPIANGGTNNNSFTSGKFIIYDGTKLASSSFDENSFSAPLTFENGLTRTGDTVRWGGDLTQNTSINQNGFNAIINGDGNFGIGTILPLQRFDVGNIFVVNTVDNRVGVGTATPAALFSVGTNSEFQIDSSGNTSLDNQADLRLLEADANGSNFTGFQAPSSLATDLVYTMPSSQGATNSILVNNGSGTLSWESPFGSGTVGYWQRLAGGSGGGVVSPTTLSDSVNIGDIATTSALIHLSGSDIDTTSFFYNQLMVGSRDAIASGTNTYLEVEGDVSPHTTASWSLGSGSYQWQNLNLANGLFNNGTEIIAANTNRLTGSIPWAALTGLRIGDGGSPVTNNALPTGISLYVSGSASMSGTLGVVGRSSLIGDVTVGGGTGKIDVGTVDPPYTINGEKYATYLVGMVGVKEEVMGKVTPSEYVPGLGYRSLIDLDGQTKGSDLWLFSKTTNIKNNLDRLAVLLTAKGQSKTWYDIDFSNKILAIYSSTPTDVIYRLTAPRFDDTNWGNTRTSDSSGFIINDPDSNNNISGTGLFNAPISSPELIAGLDGQYKILINGQENKEENTLAGALIANLKAGTQVVINLVADNLTVKNKLVSPIADIDQLKAIDATVSGTLYADNIKGKTIDALSTQLDLLNDKYSSASAILSDLQAKYTSYDSLLGNNSSGTPSGDPLALSPLATTSAVIPSDLSLNTLNVHMLMAGDIMSNGSVLAQSFSSLDSDLFIQPTGDKPVHVLANLMTLYPDGKVVVNGDVLVTGTLYANAVDTRIATVSGTLALGRGDLATDSGKLMALFDDNGQIVGSVDASGSASFGQLVTGGLVIASDNSDQSSTMSATTDSNASIGTAVIATGSAEVQITNKKVTDRTLIYLTPISNTNNNVLYVKSKQAGIGFTVAVPTQPNQVKQEISFNYWLVETK